MKTSDYEELLKDLVVNPGEIARRGDITRLREIAINLDSMRRLADAEEEEREQRSESDKSPR